MADVLATLRTLNERDSEIIYLETRELRAALRHYGCYADLDTVDSVRGWLALDELEIKA